MSWVQDGWAVGLRRTQEVYDQAVDQPVFLDLRGVAALRDLAGSARSAGRGRLPRPSSGQQILSFEPVTSSVGALHVLQPFADRVVERAADGLAGSPVFHLRLVNFAL